MKSKCIVSTPEGGQKKLRNCSGATGGSLASTSSAKKLPLEKAKRITNLGGALTEKDLRPYSRVENYLSLFNSGKYFPFDTVKDF